MIKQAIWGAIFIVALQGLAWADWSRTLAQEIVKAEMTDKEAMKLGNAYALQGDMEKAEAFYLLAASKGNDDGICKVARIYLMWNANPQLAIAQAKEKSQRVACMLVIAESYLYGLDDLKTARQWYLKVNQAGDPRGLEGIREIGRLKAKKKGHKGSKLANRQ